MLANEPAEGEEANCVFQMQDVLIPLDAGKCASVAVLLLVQVKPAPDGRLTVGYGDGFPRDYAAGSAPHTTLRVGEREIFALLKSLGMEGQRAGDALLRCAAPLNVESHRLMIAARKAGVKTPVVNRLDGSLEGPVTVPHLSTCKFTEHGQVLAEWRPSSCEGASSEDTAPPVDRRVAVVTKSQSSNAHVSEKECKFVAVVVHDGSKALYLNTSKPVTMGKITDELAMVAHKSTEVLWGVYAAQSAVRLRLGALWEWPSLGVTRSDFKLLGATGRQSKGSTVHTAWYELRLNCPLDDLMHTLTKCFHNRRPTPEAATMFKGLEAVDPASILSKEADAQTIGRVVAGRPSLTSVLPCRLEVPPRITASDMHRDDAAYQSYLETSFPTRAFEDFSGTASSRSVNTFYPLPIVKKTDDTPEAGSRSRSTRAGIREVMRNLETLLDEAAESPPRFSVRDDEDDFDDEPDYAGMGGAEAGEGDDERGREAHYHLPSLHPFADSAPSFIKRLKPAGLPENIVDQLRIAQRDDAFCQRISGQLRELHRYENGHNTECKLQVQADGRVSLSFNASTAIDERTSDGRRYVESLRRTALDFRSDRGLLYHVGETSSGKPRLEYVVPVTERDLLMECAHDHMLHLGRDRTIDALRASGMWWPSLKGDVAKFCKKCDTCAFNRVGPHVGEMHIPPNGVKPWQVVAVDIVDLEDTASGNREAIIFADRFSRSVRAFPVPRDVDSELFLNVVAFGLIPEVGVPLMMISDRGSTLISKLCLEFYEKFGGINPVEPRIADAHMHTAVGLCERFNHTLREMARAARFDHNCEWDLYLPYLVMFYNSTVQSSTGFSPFFLEHGRECRLPWHPDHEPPSNEDGSISEFVFKHILALHMAWSVCQASLSEAERKRKEHHDAKYQTNVHFKPGDCVLLLQPGRISKMDMPYVGPYRVIWGPDERDRYALRDMHGRRFNEFHVSKLKLWPRDNDIGDDYYIVDAILDSRPAADGGREYLVRWRGYGKKHDSWEPYANLTDAARAEALEFDAAAELSGAETDDGTGGAASAAAAPKKKKQKKPADAAPPAAESTNEQDQSQQREARAAARAAAREARNA